uniref:Cyclic nucleotide-binding domain-containing protein n=1 Tax=Panagrolaimus sp. PS1159 TaxID=55785 RepID=A0AC35FNK0_9BILA
MTFRSVKYRSIVGSLLQAPWACGYALLAMIAYLCKSWKNIQLITSFLHLCALILLHFIPESPRWLIVMNRIDEAALIIRKACRYNKSRLPEDLELVCCLSSMGNKRIVDDEEVVVQKNNNAFAFFIILGGKFSKLGNDCFG